MISQKFDPNKPYRYVRYGRMSSAGQNERSPDQQFDEIQRTLERLKYPWILCETIRDDAISGRYVAKRVNFKSMIDAIRMGVLTVDIIVVDTLERFGRMKNLAAIRHELAEQYGVLIVTANTGFTDPTGSAGEALGFIEQCRATEDGRVKAHNVLRGKRDAAKLKRWPGGPIPLGYRRKRIIELRRGEEEFVGSHLVPDPTTTPLVRRMYDLAHQNGWGSCRIAKELNSNKEFVALNGGRFHADTIGNILRNDIYIGTLVFARHATDISNDRRVIRRNDASEHTRVEDFCEPIIDKDVWQSVNRVREIRGRAVKNAHANKNSGKLYQPLAAGFVQRYALSGLVRCGVCGASMRVNAGASGKKKYERLKYYMCPNYHSHSCDNKVYCREDWLREAVFVKLRQRLFPPPEKAGELPEWFAPLVDEIQAHLNALYKSKQTDTRPMLERELREVQARVEGWNQSLASSTLPMQVRRSIEEQYAAALDRKAQIEADLASLAGAEQSANQNLDPKRVIERLHKLAELMERSNPTELFLALAQHIERIEIFADRKVVMRTCRLGAFEGLEHVLSASTGIAAAVTTPSVNIQKIRPRILVKRRDFGATLGSSIAAMCSRQAEDPDRFAGLGANWFWEDTIPMPPYDSWASRTAADVAALRTQGWTMAKLAESFGKSIPTIRHALKIAAERPVVAALN